jgi:hypothetical protein
MTACRRILQQQEHPVFWVSILWKFMQRYGLGSFCLKNFATAFCYWGASLFGL